MFGLVVAGRPVRTDPVQVEPTKFVFDIPNPATIHHITLFLIPTPTSSPLFPSNHAVGVYLLWPGSDWRCLGMLSLEKPSAVFRVQSGTQRSTINENDGMTMAETEGDGAAAVLGLSIEPIEVIQAQLASSLVPHSASTDHPVLNVAVNMLKHLYNYVTSFATPVTPQMTGFGSQGFGGAMKKDMVVPVKAFQDWYNSVESKLKRDPNYFQRSLQET